MKKVLALILGLITVFLCVGCSSANSYHFANNPDTVWESDDGTFTIEVGDYLFHRAIVKVGDEISEMFFRIEKDNNEIFGYTAEQLNSVTPEAYTEKWEIVSLEKDKIVISVNTSNYFVNGQQLTFNNKGENTANDGYIGLEKATEIAKKECEKTISYTSFDFLRIETHNGVDCYTFLADDLVEDQNRDNYQIIAIYVNATSGKVENIWQHN